MEFMTDLDTPDNWVPALHADSDERFVEYEVRYPATKAFEGNDQVKPDEMVVYRLEENETRRQVVKRDDDVLSPEEIKTHWSECLTAMLKESCKPGRN